MVHYKFINFRIRGFAEAARQLFALSKTPYEDVRITQEEWPAVKSEMPFGKIPVLKIDDCPLPESYAINRYLARKFGYAGKTPMEEAWVDAFADMFKDYHYEGRDYFMAMWQKKSEEEIEKIREEKFAPAMKNLFGILEKALGKSNSGFLVSSGVTWIDLLIVDHLGTLLIWTPNVLDGHKALTDWREKVLSIPEIKEWVAKRPVTNY